MRNDPLRRAGTLCALFAAVLTVLVVLEWRPLLAVDERLARDLHAHAVTHSGVTGTMRVLTDWVWDPWTMRALAALACVTLWWRGDRARALRVAVAALVASAVQQGMKALVGRERPVWTDPVDSAHYAAYPSGHGMTATVVCGMLLWLVPRSAPHWAVWTAWVVAVVSVLGVGFSRLYLGVHWTSDVLAGWLLGVALVALVASVSGRRGRACSGRSPVSPRAGDPAR
ncbi:phosphatase PAP2 family protein [Streptomyces subrutilus]|uniref:Phosphatase PAP2 family protein n=1 Tax=Streptomyces subrutilus TaxID=36818 RepID=A0A5P2USI0_9ACTN|nr:phosphatase PAP2 family protein [Streptomyces subrutilus]QEU81830.1 phosphatase PAP2 family protein [Streptomyces subrutilus]WSJ28736.1 phosphatase PAP2 family protein [Streptomyces subrutilus]GGZ90536.1 phosphatase PAP2 family protein [Streptomyces subrutilus]